MMSKTGREASSEAVATKGGEERTVAHADAVACRRGAVCKRVVVKK